MRLQPFGDDEYRVLVMGRVDNRLTVFASVGRRLLQEYSSAAITELTTLGYHGDQKHLMQDISLAWYAEVCGYPETPRAVLWLDDSKEATLEKIRDVICFQRWGKTINQYPKVREIFSKLNFGVVAEDPIGFARGAAVRALVAASFNKETTPLIYFDEMRRYPIHSEELLKVIEILKIEDEELVEFDSAFANFLADRFHAALEVLNSKKPGSKPWEDWPLKENVVWQKYIQDWDDYQSWLNKRH